MRGMHPQNIGYFLSPNVCMYIYIVLVIKYIYTYLP